MILLLIAFTFVVCSTGFVLAALSLKQAPVAFEDDSGFHLDRHE